MLSLSITSGEGEHRKEMTSKLLAIVSFVVFLGIIATLILGLNTLADSTQPVWRDFGTVQHIHNVPEWSLDGARDFQSMTITTTNHGTVNLDTGPNGNWCTGMTIWSCGSGTVGWNNGTRVFVEQRKDGKLFVGAITS